MRAAWFCPGCQRYHAPHCDTCPQPMQFGLPNTLPNIPVWTPWPSTGDPSRWTPTTGGVGAGAIGGLAGTAH